MPIETRAGKAIVILLLLSAGCPTRFDPRAETMPTSTNPQAQAAYRKAHAELELGQYRQAERSFGQFVGQYPEDNLRSLAQIDQAEAALQTGDAEKARRLLESLALPSSDESNRNRADYLLGLAAVRSGKWQRGRELLQPFVARIAPGAAFAELHGALADAAWNLQDFAAALREYEQLFGDAKAAERNYLIDRSNQAVVKLATAQALALWSEINHNGLIAAALAPRLASERAQAGAADEADAFRQMARHAQQKIGIEVASPASENPARLAVACMLPLSGKSRALGERALRGAMLAADWPSSTVSIELLVRDVADAAAMEGDLNDVAKSGVVAVLGSPDRLQSAQLAPRAAALGLPLFELATDPQKRGELTFKLVRERAAVTQAMLLDAHRKGMKTIAILAVDNLYGRTLAAAIATHAKTLGLRLLADLRYPENTTTFVSFAEKIKALKADALFVAAPANQLALIAPQLSASEVTTMPGVALTGRSTALYATADGINAQMVLSTVKYLQGAILAPAFFADASNPQVAQFVERYRNAYNEEPTALDAFAFDAVRAVRVVFEHRPGNITRAALAAALARRGEMGLTGELWFENGERAGESLLYEGSGDGLVLHRLPPAGN